MKTVVLTWINVIMSLSFAILIYVMFPVAHGVINYRSENDAMSYMPLSIFEQIFLALIPIGTCASLILFARKLSRYSPQISLAVLSFLPVIAVCWASYVVYEIFSQ